MFSNALKGFIEPDAPSPKSLIAVAEAHWQDWLRTQPESWQALLAEQGLKGKSGDVMALPAAEGHPATSIGGLGKAERGDWSALALALPVGDYLLVDALDEQGLETALIGWGLAHYRFDRFRAKKSDPVARLVWPGDGDRAQVARKLAAFWLVRDLINLPTSHMGPEDLQQAAEDLAKQFDANCHTYGPEDLIEQGFPAVHAVGRAAASDRGPRVIDITWGLEDAPKVTLVGKGVCFDTGGLDIKPASAMKLMKKDMGGAAHVLGLALMIMDADLPIRLRVIIPAVENAIAGNAMRPGDVVDTRLGKTIEIGHTDAEGRVILADALALGSESNPELMVDFATLTGAARVALGTDMPAIFTRTKSLRDDLMAASETTGDALWPLPLHEPYRAMIKGKVADITNSAEGAYGGAITAALFLDEFVSEGLDFAHIDVMAWNTSSEPGRPEGGEAMGMLAVFEMIRQRYQKIN